MKAILIGINSQKWFLVSFTLSWTTPIAYALHSKILASYSARGTLVTIKPKNHPYRNFSGTFTQNVFKYRD